jgi:capsular polysaccharide biosynthesis protein
VARVGKLLVFQHVFANNYFHFVAQSLPRLLRLMSIGDEVLSDPELKVLIDSSRQAFVRELLAAVLGSSGRLLQYDPCKVYHAQELYMAVTAADGQALPSRHDAVALHRLIRTTIGPAATDLVRAATADEQANSVASEIHDAGSHDRYMVMLDRSDAAPRLMRDGRKRRIPRQMANIEEVKAALEAVLFPAGIGLKVLAASSLTISEQFRMISRALALIGVHGAGLTNALMLPPGAALVEIVPAANPIPNHITGNGTALLFPFSSQCGFTMFWYLSGVMNLHYHALLLHSLGTEDRITVPPRPLARLVSRLLQVQRPRWETAAWPKRQHPDEL